MKMESGIDFVLTWVDGSDPEWRKLRDAYSGKESYLNEYQYREWDLLRFWFRAVERYAPWVRRIFFVTNGQRPAWLRENEKLVLVDHRDFIPPQYLPTFNANTIELNFHRIEGLSEHFVYFNDDMFLTDDVKPEFFFEDGMPRDAAVLSTIAPVAIGDPFPHFLCNDVSLINTYFDKLSVIRARPSQWFNPKYGWNGTGRTLLTIFASRFFTGLKIYHMPSSMLKSCYRELWELEPAMFDKACVTKFREPSDVNQYVFSWYNICKGNFVPRSPSTGQYYMAGKDDEQIVRSILKKTYKMLCINDNPGEFDFERSKALITEAFQTAFPQKSAFEA